MIKRTGFIQQDRRSKIEATTLSDLVCTLLEKNLKKNRKKRMTVNKWCFDIPSRVWGILHFPARNATLLRAR